MNFVKDLFDFCLGVLKTQHYNDRSARFRENIKKVIEELEDYEREILYPLATKQIDIDLDDGVKVNYPKFGQALKKISGLS